MALRKPGAPKVSTYSFPPNNYNETSNGNPSNLVDKYSNFTLRPITYENLDECVFKEFNEAFKIGNRSIPVILLDADIASLSVQNYVQYDEIKGYLNLPYFTMWRSNVAPLYRTSPSHKPVIYAIPKKKANGIVYEEWISPAPKMEKLTYVFKFMSVYREHINLYEQFINEYFKNKRSVITLDWERFEFMPSDQNARGVLEVHDREGVSGQSLYILTYDLSLIAYTRKIEDIQKRERVNTIDVRIVESSDGASTTISETSIRLATGESNS